MKKELLLGIMSIGIATLLVGSATFAYFDDTETSTGNIFVAGIIDLGFVGPGTCYMAISFLYEDSFLGVDPDTSGWSTGSGTVNLGTNHWDLLSGTADVNAYENGANAILTHRGIRGLGVVTDEDDEVDSINLMERIVITFDIPQWLNGFEVRSLFDEATGIEEGDVDWYLGGAYVGGYHLVGAEPEGGNGVLNVQFNPVLVDKIEFYVQSGQLYTADSEFAVARIYLANECMQDDEFNGLGLGIWTFEDMKPGEDDDGIIIFNEMGNNVGGTMYISCDYEAWEDDDGTLESNPNDYTPGPESDTDWTTGDDQTTTDAFAGFMQITELNYHSNPTTNLLPSITDHNGNTWIDLHDLKQSTLSVSLSANGADGDYLEMTVYFHYTAGNEYQGDIIELTMIFTLEQIMY